MRHSLSLINRELCLQLLEAGFPLSFRSTEPDEFTADTDPRLARLETCRRQPLSACDITVRHHWPPDFSRPESGRLVVIQPWEYGSVPQQWVGPINANVDQLWVPSSYVRDCFVAGGVRPEKLRVVPNGVDPARFRPDLPARPLATTKRFRFLFVGGTIHRKGIDLLLAAYANAFSAADDVCLVIKEMGRGGVYSGQTAQETIAAFRADPRHPEILYLEEMLDDREMGGLYRACDCLVHPYRGEGFGMPITEAMACGLPVIVTGMGAALDFCHDGNAYLVAAERRELDTDQIGGMRTVARPWFAEPDLEALQRCMRRVVADPEEARARGVAGRETILARFTWQRVAEVAAEALRTLASSAAVAPAVVSAVPGAGSADSVWGQEAELRHGLAAQAIARARRLALRLETDAAVSLLLQEAIAVDPESAAPYRALLEVLAMAGRYGDAFEALREVPESMHVCEVLTWRAVCFAAQGNDEAARQAAESTLIMEPANAGALCVLATLAQRRGASDEAANRYRKALEIGPDRVEACCGLGLLHWMAGEREDAWQLFCRAVTAAPHDNAALNLLRQAAEAMDRQEQAVDLLERASHALPDSRLIAVNLADVLLRTGRGERAMGVFEQALGRFGADDDLLDAALELRAELGERRIADSRGNGLSLCMIVKDEARNLPACLASVAELVDELVVVDTGSSDRTADIARAFGARVGDFAWTGSFSDARNHAIGMALGQWILAMDADERIGAADCTRIRQLLADARETDAWTFQIRVYSDRSHVQGWQANDGSSAEAACSGWFPAPKVRLFPADARIRYQGAVHELVEPALRAHGFTVRPAPVVVHNYSEAAGLPNNYQEKQQRYYELGLRKLDDDSNDPAALTELAIQAAELERFDDALGHWNRVLELVPDSVDAHFGKGHALINLKRYEEALTASRRALELAPGHREAAFNCGTCELYVGDPLRALPEIERQLAADRRHPQLLGLLAVLALAAGRPETARDAVRDLGEMHYSIGAYLGERLERLEQLGRWELAERIRRAAEAIGIQS